MTRVGLRMVQVDQTVLAQAARTAWDWTVAALPAIGFLPPAKAAAIGHATTTSTAAATVPVPSAVDVDGAPDGGCAVLERARAGVVEATARPLEPQALDPQVVASGAMVADDLAHAGVPMTRAAPALGLRARVVRIGTARAGQLLALLRTGPPTARLVSVATDPDPDADADADGRAS